MISYKNWLILLFISYPWGMGVVAFRNKRAVDVADDEKLASSVVRPILCISNNRIGDHQDGYFAYSDEEEEEKEEEEEADSSTSIISISRRSLLSTMMTSSSILAFSAFILVGSCDPANASSFIEPQRDFSTSSFPPRNNPTSSTTRSNVKETASASIITTTPTTAGGAPSSSTTTTVQESMISGFISGASLASTKTIIKYPLDTATVRLQMPQSNYSIYNPLLLFQDTYRGITSPLLWNILGASIFFAVKDATKQMLLKENMISSSRYMITFISVAIAQIPYWLIRNPSEVVKTRQQAKIYNDNDEESNNNILNVFQKVYQDSGGLAGFYIGYIDNILYALPADYIKFIVYDIITTSTTTSTTSVSPLQGAIAGAFATGIAQFLTTPLDVVRNRVMTKTTTTSNGDSNNNNDNEQKHQSYVQRFIQLYKMEGLSGLFLGVTPRIGKAILSGAIQFATYEETKQQMIQFFLVQTTTTSTQ